MNENKENWDFLGQTKTIKVRKRKAGKLIRFIRDNDWQALNRRIKVRRSKHRNGMFYEFINPIDREIFWRVFNRKSKEKLISQDKLDFFKLCGLRFYLVRSEEEI